MHSYLFRLRVFLLLSISFLCGGETRLACADDITALEQRVHKLVNEHRMAMGLKPLHYNDEIAAVARQHSRNMSRGIVGHGHEGAEERSRSLGRIISYREFGENVAGNNSNAASTAQAALSGWLNSPNHRANIEGNFDTTGIGVARGGSTFFFTQIFLTTPSSSRSSQETRRLHTRTLERSLPPEDEHDERPPRSQKAYDPDRKHDENDPRKRPGRQRVRGGYVQDLDTYR